jgi:hypothetical protein
MPFTIPLCIFEETDSFGHIQASLPVLKNAGKLAQYPGEMKVQMQTQRKAHCDPGYSMR